MPGEMVVQSSQDQDQPLENSRTRLNAGKLVLMFPFQFLSQCSHSQEIKDHSTETSTSMVKMVSNSSLNGKLLHPDGKKNLNLQVSAQYSQPINENDHYDKKFNQLIISIIFLYLNQSITKAFVFLQFETFLDFDLIHPKKQTHQISFHEPSLDDHNTRFIH